MSIKDVMLLQKHRCVTVSQVQCSEKITYPSHNGYKNCDSANEFGRVTCAPMNLDSLFHKWKRKKSSHLFVC